MSNLDGSYMVEVDKMGEKYKFAKKILEDQNIEPEVGKMIEVDLGLGLVELKILKIDSNQVLAIEE